MDLYYNKSLSDNDNKEKQVEMSLDDFIKVYSDTMGNTLKALKFYQEFLKTNNEMVEKITGNFIEMFEKHSTSTNTGFLMGFVTGYQKAKEELKQESPHPEVEKEPAKFYL